MAGRKIRNQFRKQLRSIKHNSIKVLENHKPGPLHKLRSALLRLHLLLKYGAFGKNQELHQSLMRCRRVMAGRRDCDVCLARVKQDMETVHVPKGSKYRILESIRARKRAAQDELKHLIRSKHYRELLVRAKKLSHDNKRSGLKLSMIKTNNRKWMKLNMRNVQDVHRIRKRLRAARYLFAVNMNDHQIKDRRDSSDPIIFRLKFMGDYIDGVNTVRMLADLKAKKIRGVQRIIKAERERMLRSIDLIRRMH